MSVADSVASEEKVVVFTAPRTAARHDDIVKRTIMLHATTSNVLLPQHCIAEVLVWWYSVSDVI